MWINWCKGKIRSVMKRWFLCAVLSVLCLLTACQKTTSTLHFINHTGTRLDGIYFAAENATSLYGPVNLMPFGDGTSIEISLDKLGGPGVYIVATINVDGRCVDVYDVLLEPGDSLELGPETPIEEFGTATLKVTHSDWTETTYTGFAYYEWQIEEIEGFWGLP